MSPNSSSVGLCAVNVCNNPLHAVLDVRDSSAISDGASDFVNEPEAIVIIKLLTCILHSPPLVGKRIVILASYEKQKLLISHIIKERFPILRHRPEVRIARDVKNYAVDIVLISCVETDFHGDPDFLSGYWKLARNGAIKSVFICGNLKALDTVEHLKGFIADANHRQVIHRVSSKFERTMLFDTLTKH